jgi:hypothetical protein
MDSWNPGGSVTALREQSRGTPDAHVDVQKLVPRLPPPSQLRPRSRPSGPASPAAQAPALWKSSSAPLRRPASSPALTAKRQAPSNYPAKPASTSSVAAQATAEPGGTIALATPPSTQVLNGSVDLDARTVLMPALPTEDPGAHPDGDRGYRALEMRLKSLDGALREAVILREPPAAEARTPPSRAGGGTPPLGSPSPTPVTGVVLKPLPPKLSPTLPPTPEQPGARLAPTSASPVRSPVSSPTGSSFSASPHSRCSPGCHHAYAASFSPTHPPHASSRSAGARGRRALASPAGDACGPRGERRWGPRAHGWTDRSRAPRARSPPPRRPRRRTARRHRWCSCRRSR